MSQNDFTIANQSFPAFRADLNLALQALASNNSGATEPSTTFGNMWWYDSANNIMYIRNEDNDAWIKFAELDQANDKFVLSGTLQLDDGTVSAPALTFNSDTNMGIYRGGTDILKFVTAGTDAITIDANQDVGLAGSLVFADNEKAIFGAGSDLQIYHDGGNSIISEAGAGDIIIYTNGTAFQVDSSAGANMIYATPNAYVQLFYNNAQKFATTNTGIEVTGNIDLPNSNSFILGSGHNIVQTDANTTYFYGGVNGIQLRKADNSYYNAQFSDDGSVVFNENGNDADFRVESDTSAYGLFLDGGSGHVGIHAVPTTTNSVYKGVQTGLGGTLLGRTDDTPIYLSSNLTYTDNWKYLANTTGTQIALGANMQFFTVASGIAGNTATLEERMRITSAGNFGIGTNIPSNKFEVHSGGGTNIVAKSTNGNGGYLNYSGLSSTGTTTFSVSHNGRVFAEDGIQFDSSGEVLDSYEQGTWIPSMGGTATYYYQTGEYTKIGDMVFLRGQVSINLIGTGSVSTISGLPFASKTTLNGNPAGTLTVSYYAGLAISINYIGGHVISGATTITIIGNAGNNTTIQYNGGNFFGNGARLDFTMAYQSA